MNAWMFAKRWAARCIVTMSLVGTTSLVSVAAPQQLLGKTIVVRNSVTMEYKDPNGNVITTKNTAERTIYVSTLGRVFSRLKESSNSGSQTGSVLIDQTPEQTKSDAIQYRLRGNTLISDQTIKGMHTTAVISFDKTFKNCSFSGRYKMLGPFAGPDGKMYQILRANLDSTTCSVRDGNPFAN